MVDLVSIFSPYAYKKFFETQILSTILYPLPWESGKAYEFD